MSERTIKNDIQALLGVEKKYGIHIQSIKGSGYALEIVEQARYEQVLFPLLFRYANHKEIPNDAFLKVEAVLKALLSREYASAETLAELLFVDKRSLQQTFKEARQVLQRYHLELSSRPSYGFYIKGSEFHKRLCIMDVYGYYPHRKELQIPTAFYQTIFQVEEEQRLAIRQVILKHLRSFSCTITDIHSQKFVYHVILSYQRHQQGHPMEPNVGIDLKNTTGYQFIDSLCQSLEEAELLVLPEEEKSYLCIVFLSYLDIKRKADMDDYPILQGLAEEMCTLILEQLQQDIKMTVQDPKQIQQLTFALFPISVRVRYQVYEQNHWFAQWRFANILPSVISMELGYLCLSILEKHYACKFSSEDIAQLSFVFSLMLDKQLFSIRKRKILMIPVSGYASVLPLIQKLMRNFQHCIASIEVKERYLIRNCEEMEAYDILISAKEYCMEFEDRILTLYNDSILTYDYHELYHKLMMSSLDFQPFLPSLSAIDFLEVKELKNMKEALCFAYEHWGLNKRKLEEDYCEFKDRETLIFNRTQRKQACYFRFLEEEQPDKLFVIHLEKGMLLQGQRVNYILFCFIYGAQMEKCRMYEQVLTTLLSNEAYLKQLLEEKNNQVFYDIMLK